MESSQNIGQRFKGLTKLAMEAWMLLNFDTFSSLSIILCQTPSFGKYLNSMTRSGLLDLYSTISSASRLPPLTLGSCFSYDHCHMCNWSKPALEKTDPSSPVQIIQVGVGWDYAIQAGPSYDRYTVYKLHCSEIVFAGKWSTIMALCSFADWRLHWVTILESIIDQRLITYHLSKKISQFRNVLKLDVFWRLRSEYSSEALLAFMDGMRCNVIPHVGWKWSDWLQRISSDVPSSASRSERDPKLFGAPSTAAPCQGS